MYAVFKNGGKQYKVAEGQTLRLEKIEAETGSTIEFTDVLLVEKDGDVTVGHPIIENGKILAEVVEHGRDKKIKIVKFNRRKHHRKQMGHRQWFTSVKIMSINS